MNTTLTLVDLGGAIALLIWGVHMVQNGITRAFGLVALVPALAVMLGANVGTTLIVQVLSFDVSRVSFLLILIGVFMFRRSGGTPTRDLGRVGIGLGLMLIALQHLFSMIIPFEDVPSLRMLLGAVTTEPLIDILLAAA